MSDSFFRSLSLVEDLAVPHRFSHYRPTRRAAPIVEAILQPRSATIVIAPYGSGKSLAAGVGALAVRAGEADREVVSALVPSMALVAPEIALLMRQGLTEKRAGRVVVLSGYAPAPLAAIAAQLGLETTPGTVDGLARALAKLDADHIAIVWDEFGRHLEGLVADGRSADMDLVQRLAERASRASGPTLSLTLLLHQNLLAYASRLNETTRSEWRKIEGRFASIRLVEDSQEIYALIGDVVQSLRTGKQRKPLPAGLVQRVRAAQWLDGMEDEAAIVAVLSNARPLTAGALQVLPSIVARVGQNERSIFTFLREMDLRGPLGIEQVYAAFSDSMRSDVGIGGSYRRWVETESARSRAKDALQRELIAAACLLQLGVSGERIRLPRDILELAVVSEAHGPEEIRLAVDSLIAANLLIWRRHNDDVAVWHGADIDVGLRVREERDRLAEQFDLIGFLNTRFPAPNLRTPGHNARFGVNRHFRGVYATIETLREVTDESPLGSIIYVITRTRADIEKARAFVTSPRAGKVIHVIPRQPAELGAASLELVALESLRSDTAFLASDPMVATELDELQSVAFEQLAMALRPLLTPRGPNADWWAEGRRLVVTTDQPGSVAASDLFSDWFKSTPRIDNDQLMREQASRTMQTARVRIIGGILSRSDRPRFGLEDHDRGAEGSIYRTVFEKTGLHRSDDGRFAHVEELTEPGLKLAWSTIADFFRTPTSKPRPLAELTSRLQAPPIGLPAGITPLLVAAGYKQFASTVGLYRAGAYEHDLLGFQFDRMIVEPDEISVQVVAVDIPLRDYLRELCYAFSHEHPGAHEELFRAFYDAVQRWRATVPDAARRTDKVDATARRLLAAIASEPDPIALALERLPAVFGSDKPSTSIIAPLELARKGIDALRDAFADEAVRTACEAFRLRRSASSDLLQVVRDWASCFEHGGLVRGDALRISDQAVLSRAIETANGRFSPKSFVGALSSILLKTGLEKWDDRSAAEFRTALREARERIEAAALEGSLNTALRPIILARLEDLQSRLDDLDAAEANAMKA
ncbi:MAG: hypothetical protein ACK4SI_09700 [Brevundimonas aurantiaca]|uniref:hypothetical protein n=1 Tax=Brevundimonas aurantiaca TaxID=74316 RepID=UPI00391882B7